MELAAPRGPRACVFLELLGRGLPAEPRLRELVQPHVTAHVTHFPETESEIHRLTALTLGSQNDSGSVAQSLRGGQALRWCTGPGLGLGLQTGRFWVLALL